MTKRYRVKIRNIVMGVPITFLDKYCPEQFEIETNSTMSGVSANFWTYINGSPKYARIFIRKKHKKTKRYRIKVRNIVIGVPITFLDKYNPDQFEIVSFRKGDNGEDLIFSKKKRTSSTVLLSLCTTSIAGMIKNKEGLINGKPTYARITIRKVV